MFAQIDRPLILTTPLGKDALLLLGFQGREAISEMFRFELQTAWENQKNLLPFDQLLGKKVTIEMTYSANKRYINGMVSRITQGFRDDKFTYYVLEIVPELWLLGRKVPRVGWPAPRCALPRRLRLGSVPRFCPRRRADARRRRWRWPAATENLRLRSRRRRRWPRRGPPAARREWVKSVKTCGFPGFHLKRSMERMIMSLTAEMAATLASKPRAAPVRSTMSSAGLIRGNATYPSGPASGWPGR